MKGLIAIIATGALLLAGGCSKGPKELRSYDLTVGPKKYTVKVYSDSTTTLSYGGHVRLAGRYDTIYPFEVNGRHYLGIDDYDDMMSVYTPELRELMPFSLGIRDVFIVGDEDGGRHGFMYRRPEGKYGLLDEDMRQVYRAVYDSIALCADLFQRNFKDSRGNTISVTDTVEYVRLLDEGRRGIGDMSGRILVPIQACDRIGVYAEHYFSDPNSAESREYLPIRHGGSYGDSEAVMGYAVVNDDTFSFYGLDGTLIVPPGAIEAFPVYWDDPKDSRYWLAYYRDTADGTQMEGVFRTDGTPIIQPRHHLGQRIYLRGEDKQVSEGRYPHDIMIATRFEKMKTIYEYFDYEGKKIN
ncbi:MAG: hypothetical protein K2M06_06465 [Muribaculaceae bacterium]|nr:hypothetical protein [Muribaculaceae bacterium]